MIDANDPRLTAYALGELSDEQCREIEEALSAHPELAQQVAEIQRTAAVLGILASAPQPQLTDQQRSEIARQVRHDSRADSTASQTAESKTARTETGTGTETAGNQSEFVMKRPVETRNSGGIWKLAAGMALVAMICVGLYALSGNGLGLRQLAQKSAKSDTKHGEAEPTDRDFVRNEEMTSKEGSLESGVVGDPNPDASVDTRGDGDSNQSSSGGKLGGFSTQPGFVGDQEESESGREANQAKQVGAAGPGGPDPADRQHRQRDGDAAGGDSGDAPDLPAKPDGYQGRPQLPASAERNHPFSAEDGAVSGRRPKVPSPAGNADDDIPAIRLSRPAPPTSQPAPANPVPRGEGRELADKKPADRSNSSVSEAPLESASPADSQATPGETTTAPAPSGGGKGKLAQGKSEDAKSDEGKEAEPEGDTSQAKKASDGKNPNQTWRRAAATPNASRLMLGDSDELAMKGMQVNVQVDGFRARVLLDCYYYNDRGRQLEGTFKLRLPNEASLYYFAFGETSFSYRPMVDQLTSRGFLSAELVRASGTGPREILKARSKSWGKVKEARVVPREKAAHAYAEVVRRRVDPALVEWAGAGVFQARVFPLMPKKLHRIVIGYDVNLQQLDASLRYQLDIPAGLPECVVDLDLSALPGTSAAVQPQVRPFMSGGRAFYHFQNPKASNIRVDIERNGTSMLTGSDDSDTPFFATRVTPVLPEGTKNSGADRGVFLLDTSLSANPDKFNIWLNLLQATLENNRDSMKEFAVLFFNIEAHWWEKGYVKNTPANIRRLIGDCQNLSLEGATDLGQALRLGMNPNWSTRAKQRAAKKSQAGAKPDVFLLSDGALTWGETNQYLLADTVRQSDSTLFAYNTGLTGTSTHVLENLARESGGSLFAVTGESEIDKVSRAHRSRPWQLIEATVAGSSDLLVAGRIRSIYPGQSLLLVGRGTPANASGQTVVLRVRRGSELREVSVPINRVIRSDLTARVYGQVAVGQLEDLMSGAEDVATAYARHFRVTGRTCSLLMLESERDYQRFNIKPEDDEFVVKSTLTQQLVERKLDELADSLRDPKANVLAWLAKLEKTPGVQFRLPSALRSAIDRLPQEAFRVEAPQLECMRRDRESLQPAYFQQLSSGKLDYQKVVREATRRLSSFGPADALRAVSSLVEQNPGDVLIARDVAFSAMEWNLGGQAYPLLVRVARDRPHLPQTYQALGQCLASMDHADLALVYYEVALNGQWHARYPDFHRICSVEYLHLLQRIERGELSSRLPTYVEARRQSLVKNGIPEKAGLVVTMMWNTDRTDVDLHVVEPSGAECFYKNRHTPSGGQITRDATEGFGPEMYWAAKAQTGVYRVLANYFAQDANRTKMRTKVYVTVYQDFGSKTESVSRHTVMLEGGKNKRELVKIKF